MPDTGKATKMSDTYGPTYALPLMRYDLDSQSWRTCEDTSLWDLEMSSPTFPESGMTRDGLLYERPTQALPTAGHGYSSLPTPAARDYKDESFSPRVLDGRSHGELPEAIGLQFLPTPTSSQGRNATSGRKPDAIFNAGTTLQDVVYAGEIGSLLPTPTVMDMGSSYTPEEWEDWKDEQREKHQNGNGHEASLTQELIGVNTSMPSEGGRLSRGKPPAQQSKEMEGQGSLLSLLNG